MDKSSVDHEKDKLAGVCNSSAIQDSPDLTIDGNVIALLYYVRALCVAFEEHGTQLVHQGKPVVEVITKKLEVIERTKEKNKMENKPVD